MPPIKDRAIILKVIPFRESSYILYLFTESQGLIHGISKGFRSTKKGQNFLERGFCIELQIYIKPNRELHTVSGIQTLEFFTSIRSSLIKTAVRDTIFEIVLSAIKDTDPHPELYQSLMERLFAVDDNDEKVCYPFHLWQFLYQFADLMGVYIDMETCIICRNPIGNNNAFLNISKGGIECQACSHKKNSESLFSLDIRKSISDITVDRLDLPIVSNIEVKAISRSLIDYCMHHFEMKKYPASLVFLT